MSEKEYVVSLNRNVDYAAFDAEMIASTGAGAIPNRAVDIADPREGSYRNTHYMLTDEEAAALREDDRVYAVEINPLDRDDIFIGRHAVQESDFTKTTSDSGAFVNWGLRRLNETDDPYTGNTVDGGYNYTIKGTGVDVVIMDGGIYSTHPEFADREGNSRVQNINWYSAAGVSGTQPSGFYNDYSGHGTHVAGIATGLYFGWAKDAQIFSMKVQGLEGSNDPSVGISYTTAFDLMKLWHRNKPIEPSTGYKRPTVINMSWGFFSRYIGVTGGTYRGVPWTGINRDTNRGMTGSFDGVSFNHPYRVASVDVDVQELIDEGVHVVIASGNDFHKVDVPGGDDYDNSWNSSFYGDTRFYHRGMSPYDDEAFIVNNVDSTVGAGAEQKAQSSNSGPGTTVFAPGTNIMSAASVVADFATADYEQGEGSSFFQQANISGTSMAAPQVAGMIALYLGLNPSATPAQVKTWFMSNVQDNKLTSTGLDTDYGNSRSLWGGENKFAYNIYNSNILLSSSFPTHRTYALTKNVLEVDEGQSFTITLTTENVANGTSVPYTITGIESEDIDGVSLTGNFVVNSNTASLTFPTTVDLTTEGDQNFVLTLDNGKAEIGIQINDTSTTDQRPVYTLTKSADVINEGDTVTFTLSTKNVEDGLLGYTITGIDEFDLSSGSITGNINLVSGAGSVSITLREDQLTEGTELITFSLDDPFANPVFVSVTDTSKTPTYSLSVSDTEIDEGFGVTFTLTTTDVFDGTSVPYTITGISASDINESLTGSFIVNDNTATTTITTTRDLTTEGSEVMQLELDGRSEFLEVDLLDASPARPPGVQFDIFISKQGDNAFEVAGQDRTTGIFGNNIDINIDYGDTILFTVSSAGRPIYMKDVQGPGTDNQVGDSVGQGATSGTITFRPRARGIFYYQSSLFNDAHGRIIVS